MDEKRVINTMFLMVPSLFIVLLTATGNSGLLQSGADAAFGSFVQSSTLRLYLFDGLLFLPFVLLAAWSIRGVEGHGRRVGEVLNE